MKRPNRHFNKRALDVAKFVARMHSAGVFDGVPNAGTSGKMRYKVAKPSRSHEQRRLPLIAVP
jgi:hypothetical protein